MTTYRIHGDALLRLASMAADNPSADPDTILAIVRSAEVDSGEPAMPQVDDGPTEWTDAQTVRFTNPDLGGVDKPAKPE